jgi:hypothetical protein
MTTVEFMSSSPYNKATGSRYRRVPASKLPWPHVCQGCGSGDFDCIDLDLQFDDDRLPLDRLGAVLLCVRCFRNAAEEMGYVHIDNVAPVETRTADNLIIVANNFVKQIERAADEYRHLANTIFTTPDSSSLAIADTQETQSVQQARHPSIKAVDESERSTPEPGDIEGHFGIPADSVLDSEPTERPFSL